MYALKVNKSENTFSFSTKNQWNSELETPKTIFPYILDMYVLDKALLTLFALSYQPKLFR